MKRHPLHLKRNDTSFRLAKDRMARLSIFCQAPLTNPHQASFIKGIGQTLLESHYQVRGALTSGSLD